jgi:hypothetical protein
VNLAFIKNNGEAKTRVIITKKLVRHHCLSLIEFFGGIHQYAYLSEYLDNKKGTLRNNLDHQPMYLKINVSDDRNEGS